MDEGQSEFSGDNPGGLWSHLLRAGRFSVEVDQRGLDLPPETHCTPVPDLLQPDLSVATTRARLRSVGSKEAIPHREHLTVVAVRFWLMRRMVNAVHVRCDDQPLQSAIK